jgi:hypothetical protein
VWGGGFTASLGLTASLKGSAKINCVPMLQWTHHFRLCM